MQYYAAYQFTGLIILGKLTAGIFASCTVLLPLTRVIPRVAHSLRADQRRIGHNTQSDCLIIWPYLYSMLS